MVGGDRARARAVLAIVRILERSSGYVRTEGVAIVRAIRIARAKRIVFDVDGAAALILLDAADLPSAQNCIRHAALVEKALAPSHWQLVGVTQRDYVRNIGACNRTLRSGIVVVLIERRAKECILCTRADAIL